MIFFLIHFPSPSQGQPDFSDGNSRVVLNSVNEKNYPNTDGRRLTSSYENWSKYQSNIRYFHSDQRCINDIILSNYNEITSTNTKYGKLTGRIAYLCDMPGINLRERPVIFHERRDEGQSNPRSRVVGNVTLFLGVPYAKPPTKENNLRFKSPISPQFWGSIDSIEYKASCPQPIEFTGPHRMIHKIDEDCLYMNIFSPYVGPGSALFPVMVYIHDGDFEHGSGNLFPGHMLSAFQQVVVVTFNYRLGLLGYFSTGDTFSPGNFGLLDQIQALYFIRENIHNFNGDPNQITVFGTGSGAVSASLLALSPLSSKFVKRVIASSGSPMANWAVIKDRQLIHNNSLYSASAFGCAISQDSMKLVTCLSSRSHGDISSTRVRHNFNWLTWGPVIDSNLRPLDLQVVPHLPERLIRLQSESTWSKNNFSYMTGFTRDDGSNRLLKDQIFERRKHFVDYEFFSRIIKSFVTLYNGNSLPVKAESLENAVKFLYAPYPSGSTTGSAGTSSSSLLSSIVHLLTDSWYLSPLHSMVRELTQNEVPTYVYLLNYSLSSLKLPQWQAVPHDLEYLLVSGAPFLDPSFYPSDLNLHLFKWSESDRNMSQFIMQAWANFAKFGNPTPTAAFSSIVWKATTKMDPLSYLLINDTSSHHSTRMESQYRTKYSQFWSDYIKVILEQEKILFPLEYEPIQLEIRFYRTMFWTLVAISTFLSIFLLFCSCVLCSQSRSEKRDKIYTHKYPQGSSEKALSLIDKTDRSNSGHSLEICDLKISLTDDSSEKDQITSNSKQYKLKNSAQTDMMNQVVPYSLVNFPQSLRTREQVQYASPLKMKETLQSNNISPPNGSIGKSETGNNPPSGYTVYASDSSILELNVDQLNRIKKSTESKVNGRIVCEEEEKKNTPPHSLEGGKINCKPKNGFRPSNLNGVSDCPMTSLGGKSALMARKKAETHEHEQVEQVTRRKLASPRTRPRVAANTRQKQRLSAKSTTKISSISMQTQSLGTYKDLDFSCANSSLKKSRV